MLIFVLTMPTVGKGIMPAKYLCVDAPPIGPNPLHVP
jgi:hypothetical protein